MFVSSVQTDSVTVLYLNLITPNYFLLKLILMTHLFWIKSILNWTSKCKHCPSPIAIIIFYNDGWDLSCWPLIPSWLPIISKLLLSRLCGQLAQLTSSKDIQIGTASVGLTILGKHEHPDKKNYSTTILKCIGLFSRKQNDLSEAKLILPMTSQTMAHDTNTHVHHILIFQGYSSPWVLL